MHPTAPAVLPAPPAEVELARDVLAALRPQLEGEARFDRYTRMMYATDASLYQVLPVGVVMPRTNEDVHATLSVARQFGVPITARGSGSSLAGQAVGPGLVLDFTKFMHRTLAVDEERRTARVQPGLVLDVLNRELAPLGLMYGPDPASSSRATFGGMIGNNSTGTHSILYGMTHDHVRSLRVLLSDGSETTMEPVTQTEAAQKAKLAGVEGAVYRTAQRLVAQHREEIEARFPRHWRAVSGYGLNRLLDQSPLDLAPLLVGSEGTLALTLEAEVALVPRPTHTALAVLHFAERHAALEAVPSLLTLSPTAIEYLDRYMIGLTRKQPEYAPHLTFVEGDPAVVLLVEFYGESEAELESKLDRLERFRQQRRIGYASVQARTVQQISDVWYVRKAGLGLLMSSKSDWKPIPFIEDGAVPPEQLATFVREVEQILRAHDTEVAIYAHASAGCLHIRPLLNLKRTEDVATMRSITEAWAELIVALNGAPSGEHGDGRARSEWNSKLFGPTLYDAFCELKDTFDPEGLLNPGIIVRADRMTENLRYGSDYRTTDLAPTALSFEDFGSFTQAVEQCSGIGVCRRTGEGVMCPSYMATRDEEHSTRGRANALRGALSGVVPREELLSPRMYEVLDLCLECKACKAECPTQVDLAKIKYEFLHHYYNEHGLPLRNRLFGNIHRLNRLGSATAPLSNWLASSLPARWAQARLGIAGARTLPPFARQEFVAWFENRRKTGDQRREHEAADSPSPSSVLRPPSPLPGPPSSSSGHVVLFADTFTRYNYPEVGQAAVRLLESAGYRVVLPEPLGCCGRPMISKGMLGQATETLARTVEALRPYAEQGLPIIGLEPSCLLTFREEAPDLLRSEAADRVAAHVWMIDEWLIIQHGAGALDLRWRDEPRELLLHGHCHHKASGIQQAVAALNLPPRYEATLIDAGCCGMAGAFGFETEHYEISQRIGEDRLFPTLRAHPDADIAVTGVSCRQQIAHFTGRQPRHLVEWLAEAVER